MFKYFLTSIIILVSGFAMSQPELWGTTSQGGSINAGTIFKLDTAGNNYNLEYDWLNLNDGKKPLSGLMQASNNKLYGVTFQDGANFGGVLFEYDYNTNSYTKKHDFIDATGSFPEGELMQASDGKLYGLTGFGGAFNFGTLFEYDLSNSTFTSLVDFDYTVLGGSPHGKLVEAPNGKLYGLNSHGGTGGYGTLFEFDPSSGIANTVVNLDSITDGFHPYGGLILASNGSLYALSYSGGLTNEGVLFEFDYSTGTTIKHEDFIGVSNGAYPYGDLIEATNGKLYGLTYEGGLNNNGTLFEFDISTNTLTKKVDFGGVTPGSNPKGTLVQSANGKLYGYTSLGGTSNKGIIFEYDIIADTLIKKLDFNGANGQYSAGNALLEICLNPTINISISTNDTVCQNESIILNATGTNPIYTWNNGITNNTTFTPTIGNTTYVVTATNICGTTVDSIQITTNPSYSISVYDTICSGSNYSFPDGSTANNLTNDTNQVSTLNSVLLCDSIITTEIHINPTYSIANSFTICSGDSYTFADGFTQNNITSNYIYISNLLTTESCDSIITTTINVNPSYSQAQISPICSGDSFTFPDGFTQNNITATTTHISSFQTALNCDSLITTTISVNQNFAMNQNIQICFGDNYTFPDGTVQNNITTSITQISSLQSIQSCDSIITTNISINPIFTVNLIDSTCFGSNYIFPDGSVTTNIQSDTTQISLLTSINFCDSNVVTSVFIKSIYNINETFNICNGGAYTFPDGFTQNNITSTFTHISNLITVDFCDSIIQTTININPVYSISESFSICSGGDYTFPDGFTQNNITSTTAHISNLATILNCDSTITTIVFINPIYNLIDNVQLCSGDDYTFPDGFIINNIQSDTAHISNLSSTNSCDTVITTTIHVNPTHNVFESDTICSGSTYIYPDGLTETNVVSSTSHISVIPTVLTGCDSIITTTLFIHSLDNLVTQNGITLVTTFNVGPYQWLDCENNFAPIVGENNQSFIPLINGTYAVIVSDDLCSDTSACFNINNIGISEEVTSNFVLAYPNPTTDIVYLRFTSYLNESEIKISNLTGETVARLKNQSGTEVTLDLSSYERGIYTVEIVSDSESYFIKIVKQ